jgi:striatin 1/3/4
MLSSSYMTQRLEITSSDWQQTKRMVRSLLTLRFTQIWSLNLPISLIDGTNETQINAIAVHPSLPLLATAHEDRFVRIFDLSMTSHQPILSTLAHLDGVTALSFDSSTEDGPRALATVSHDTSLRLWNLTIPPFGSTATMTCVQEISSHRVNSSEGVLDVAHSRDGASIVTAGADGTLRVWQQK